MVFKGIIAATVAVGLSATPALAAATSARAVSTQVAPATETVNGSQLDGDSGDIIVIILALIAAGLGVWALLDNNHGRPNSP